MSLRPLPRSLVVAALCVVTLHVAAVVFLGTSPFGSLVGNALQIFSSFLAAAMCFQAARRSPSFGRSFWILVGFGMAVWGVSDFGWMYYEIFRFREPPPGSLIRFLFDTHGMFFVMAIFLNQDKEDSRVDTPEVLDFVQIGILFFLVYFGAYYLPAINLGYQEALVREFEVMTAGVSVIFLLALIQWRRSATREAQRLFGGLAAYILVYGTLATVVSKMQLAHEMPTGTWSDLGWTIPLLFGAFWAATWQSAAESEARVRKRNHSLAEILVNNGMFFFAPMVILIQVAQLGPGLRAIRFTLLGVSFSCYAVRIGLTQYRQQQGEETVRRQTLAMDSSIEGIGILDDKGVHSYANSALASMLGFDSPQRIVGQPWKVVYAFQPLGELESQVRKGLRESGKWSGNLQL